MWGTPGVLHNQWLAPQHAAGRPWLPIGVQQRPAPAPAGVSCRIFLQGPLAGGQACQLRWQPPGCVEGAVWAAQHVARAAANCWPCVPQSHAVEPHASSMMAAGAPDGRGAGPDARERGGGRRAAAGGVEAQPLPQVGLSCGVSGGHCMQGAHSDSQPPALPRPASSPGSVRHPGFAPCKVA